MTIRTILSLVLAASATFTFTANAQLRVEQINAENAAELMQAGPDATGGVGDWFLSNGTVCAVFSDLDHEGEFSAQGGTLIDLGFCNRADDHFTTTQDLLGGTENPVNSEQIKTQLNDQDAAIIVSARNGQTFVETRYSLNMQRPKQLAISKQITARQEDQPSFNYYSPLWFNYHSLETYVYASLQPANSKGFSNEDFVSRGGSAIRTAAHNADTLIYLSPPEAEFPIAYGWQTLSATRNKGERSYAVPTFVLADESSTGMFILTDSFYLGDGSKIGLLQLPQIPLLSLDEGDSLVIEQRILLGARADTASITDQLLPNEVSVTGRVDEAASALHVETLDGTPVTFVRPDASGAFAFKARAGDYQIRHRGSADREQVHSIAVQAVNLEVGELSLPKVARVTLPSGHAMRLVFVGLDGTDDPDFDDRLTEYSVNDDDGKTFRDKVSQVFLAGVSGDRSSVDVAPGRYRVYATRGPEYSLSSAVLEIKASKTYSLDIDIPQQQVATPGYIAADLHVHTGLSFDNTFSTEERVRTFVAEHGEVMVSSEHDRPTDFAPRIAAMGVADKITSIAAVEMTSIMTNSVNPYTGGHANFFPVEPQATAFRQGMINHEHRRMRDVLHDFRQRNPAVVAQLNHARLNLQLSGALPDDWQSIIENGQFLDHMGTAGHPYQPELALHEHPNSSLIEAHPDTGVRDIDFDLMELINPSDKYANERILALRKDWLSFLQQGLRITGTANSDSHHANEQVAVPRNMVAVAGDTVATFNQQELVAALKGGNSYGTSGPMLEIDLSGKKMGETLAAASGILTVKISHADWIPVDTLKVQFNGKQLAEFDVSIDKEIALEIATDQDGFVTIEVSGKANEAYSEVYPGMFPYAFSNPIYIDFDADGEWQAPGL